VLDADGRILRVFLNDDGALHLPPDAASRIPERLRLCVVTYEDRRFYDHLGISPAALARAVVDNLVAGRWVSGASTITMQVARISGGRPRTLPAKVLEMLQAVKLEATWGKERILKAYLDHAPYGGNIVGVRAASAAYFGKEPAQLSWAEAATIAVLPNAPGLISPVSDAAELRHRRDRLLERMHAAGHLDTTSLVLALREPVPRSRKPMPFEAPHFTRYVLSRSSEQVIRSTLDLGVQTRVEELVAHHRRSLMSSGVPNLSVLVAETQSGSVRAYVGSQDFDDFEHAGRVDGVRAPRSTGSLLKPFLYALAMDNGLVVGESLVPDVPVQFGSFAPVNADRDYRGLVSVREALIYSLNVPAVEILQEYGLDRFYRFLKDAGLAQLFRTPADYGLPLALGGAEATLLELTALYRGLARGGRFGTLRITGAEQVSPDRPLLSPGAAFLTLQMLRDLKRPGSEMLWEIYEGGIPVAWKTGTSYGQKDAWAVGVTPTWTIGVWAGDFTGRGNPNLSGSRSAGPLLFDLVNRLQNGPEWFAPEPGSLRPVRVWRDTGYRAPEGAADVGYAHAPAGAPPLPACPYHVRVFLSADGTHRVSGDCWSPGNYRAETRLIYPPRVAQFLREAGRPVPELPPLLPGCGKADSASSLQIVYPEAGARLWIPRDLDGSFQKVTLRVAHSDTGPRVFWYLDGIYLGESRGRHNRSLVLSRGQHVLVVVDEHGRRQARSFRVVGGRAE
jgi:penicillin-binding protein 1C